MYKVGVKYTKENQSWSVDCCLWNEKVDENESKYDEIYLFEKEHIAFAFFDRATDLTQEENLSDLCLAVKELAESAKAGYKKPRKINYWRMTLLEIVCWCLPIGLLMTQKWYLVFSGVIFIIIGVIALFVGAEVDEESGGSRFC